MADNRRQYSFSIRSHPDNVAVDRVFLQPTGQNSVHEGGVEGIVNRLIPPTSNFSEAFRESYRDIKYNTLIPALDSYITDGQQ